MDRRSYVFYSCLPLCLVQQFSDEAGMMYVGVDWCTERHRREREVETLTEYKLPGCRASPESFIPGNPQQALVSRNVKKTCLVSWPVASRSMRILPSTRTSKGVGQGLIVALRIDTQCVDTACFLSADEFGLVLFFW